MQSDDVPMSTFNDNDIKFYFERYEWKPCMRHFNIHKNNCYRTRRIIAWFAVETNKTAINWNVKRFGFWMRAGNSTAIGVTVRGFWKQWRSKYFWVQWNMNKPQLKSVVERKIQLNEEDFKLGSSRFRWKYFPSRCESLQQRKQNLPFNLFIAFTLVELKKVWTTPVMVIKYLINGKTNCWLTWTVKTTPFMFSFPILRFRIVMKFNSPQNFLRDFRHESLWL